MLHLILQQLAAGSTGLRLSMEAGVGARVLLSLQRKVQVLANSASRLMRDGGTRENLVVSWVDNWEGLLAVGWCVCDGGGVSWWFLLLQFGLAMVEHAVLGNAKRKEKDASICLLSFFSQMLSEIQGVAGGGSGGMGWSSSTMVTIMVALFLIGIPMLACIDSSTTVGCDRKIIFFLNYV